LGRGGVQRGERREGGKAEIRKQKVEIGRAGNESLNR
jgi:hypothetical protein